MSELLEKSYKSAAGNYELLCEDVIKQINKLLHNEQIKLATPIISRVKEWDSLLQKSKSLNPIPEDISEINDVAGIRIIALFERDISKICSIIDKTFTIHRKEDTSIRLDENQFGYGSVHYEISLNNEWLTVPTFKGLEGLKAEIQVRTASQNIWAAASHTLQYKKEGDVPPPLKRSINRIAAILELVDLEFERLLNEKKLYLDETILSNNQITDVDTLEQFLDMRLPEKYKSSDERYSRLLDNLKKYNLTNKNDLEELIVQYIDFILEREKAFFEKYKSDIEFMKELQNDVYERFTTGVVLNQTTIIDQMIMIRFDINVEDYYN